MDHTAISSINKHKILKELFREDDKSKAELAKYINLSKPAIGDNVSSLINTGIIIEMGEGESSRTGGRKPTMLRFNKNFKYIVCIDLSFKDPKCAVGNLYAELLNEKVINVPETASRLEKLNAVAAVIKDLIEESVITKEEIGCMVISSPGIVTEEGEYFYTGSQFIKWTEIGINQYLESLYNIPVIIKNDVNLAVLAEKEIGAGKNYSNLIYISCGLGLGSGIILNDSIYEGKHFAAGEIGYFSESQDKGNSLEECVKLETVINKIINDICSGCETVLSEITGSSKPEYEHIIEAYKRNDRYVRNIFSSIGNKIGIAVRNIVSLLDLEMVILGGIYTEFSEEILTSVNNVFDSYKLFKPIILPSRLGTLGSIYGAFVLGGENVLKQCCK